MDCWCVYVDFLALMARLLQKKLIGGEQLSTRPAIQQIYLNFFHFCIDLGTGSGYHLRSVLETG